jgi:hypothetical protein
MSGHFCYPIDLWPFHTDRFAETAQQKVSMPQQRQGQTTKPDYYQATKAPISQSQQTKRPRQLETDIQR